MPIVGLFIYTTIAQTIQMGVHLVQNITSLPALPQKGGRRTTQSLYCHHPERIAMGFVRESVIDSYLGGVTYDWYYELLGDAGELRSGYEAAHSAIPEWDHMNMMQQLDVLQNLEHDIDDAFQRISDGQRIERRQVLELLQFFELLRDNVQRERDVFDAS
jgi:hypothetical protein